MKTSEQNKARLKVYRAVLSGALVRPSKCSRCGLGGRIEAHHEDYSKPLEVTWLCHSCYLKLHMEERWKHGFFYQDVNPEQ